MGIKTKKSISNIFKIYFSEQVYLICVALIFFSISIYFGLQIWVLKTLPISYISVFTSSLFLVFTILLLSLLLKVREKREWMNVKERVNETLGWQMKNILAETTYLLDFPSELLFSAKTDLKEFDKSYAEELLAQINFLHKIERKDVKLSHIGENMLTSDGKKELSSSCEKTLYEIDLIMIVGTRFLNAQVTSSLIKLRQSLRSLIELTQTEDFEEEYFLSFMAITLLDIVNDIYDINNLGIKIHRLQ
jgi:hypothetical protein